MFFLQSEPPVFVKRWCRIEKRKVDMNMPKMIEAWVELIWLIRWWVRTGSASVKRKWWWCFFTWSLSISAINAWRLYRLSSPIDDTVPYLKFLRDVVCQTLKVHGEARMRPGVALTI